MEHMFTTAKFHLTTHSFITSNYFT